VALIEFAPPRFDGGRILNDVTAPATGIELAHRLLDVAVDHLAEDVVLLDLTELTAFADYFVIATIDNERQLGAVIEALDGAARDLGRRAQAEGAPESGWVLVDVGGVVIHLFSLEQRVRYDLESLWSHAREVVRVQ
jgi:ribosome-associated protein